MSTESPSEPEQQDLPDSEEPQDLQVKTGPSAMQLEWQRERRVKAAIIAGVALLLLAIGGMIVAMNSEPEISSMSDRMDQLDRQASQKAAAAATVEPEPAADQEAIAESEPEQSEAVAPEGAAEALKAEEPEEGLDMPPALIKMVNERMSADSRERFRAQWAGMNEDQRQRYLDQLGL